MINHHQRHGKVQTNLFYSTTLLHRQSHCQCDSNFAHIGSVGGCGGPNHTAYATAPTAGGSSGGSSGRCPSSSGRRGPAALPRDKTVPNIRKPPITPPIMPPRALADTPVVFSTPEEGFF